MSAYVALLRGINVGGRRKLAMADLRAMAEAMGFDGVSTVLQSGNLVFRTAKRATAGLERALEGEAKRRLGLETAFLVRTGEEWRAIVAGNPMPREAKSDPSHLVVVSLKSAPTAFAVKALASAIPGRETLRARGRELYVHYPDGIGSSKLTAALIDRALGTRGTARNWNTVLKLAQLVA